MKCNESHYISGLLLGVLGLGEKLHRVETGVVVQRISKVVENRYKLSKVVEESVQTINVSYLGFVVAGERSTRD
jgi:hypothetical protein